MVQTLININGDVRDASSLTVPQDRRFREAWTFNGNAVEVDTAKQREIFRRLVIEERDRRMEAAAVNPDTGLAYTAIEQRTWANQVEEARAFVADANAPTPMLSRLAQVSGRTVEQMAQRVLGLRNALADKTGAIMAAAEELAASDTVPDSIKDWDGWP